MWSDGSVGTTRQLSIGCSWKFWNSSKRAGFALCMLTLRRYDSCARKDSSSALYRLRHGFLNCSTNDLKAGANNRQTLYWSLGLLAKMLVSMIIHLKNEKGQEESEKHQGKNNLIKFVVSPIKTRRDKRAEGATKVWRTRGKTLPSSWDLHVIPEGRWMPLTNALLYLYLCVQRKRKSLLHTSLFSNCLSFTWLLGNGTWIGYSLNGQFYLPIWKLLLGTFYCE